MRHARIARLAAAAAAFALLVGPAAPWSTGGVVRAHAQLVASSPGAGEVVPESPGELRLVFSEPLEVQVTSLDVRGADGSVVLERAGSTDPADAYVLVAALPDLPDGTYSVTWRTLSAADGHTVEGFFSFGVGDPAAVGALDPGGATHTEASMLDRGSRLLTTIGLLGALGMAVFHRVVLRTGPVPRRFVVLLGSGLALAGLATLVSATANALDGGGLTGYLLGSRNGSLQLARGVVGLLGATLLLVLPPRLAVATTVTAALAGIALLVAAGHPAALPGVAPLLGGVIHVAGAGVWLGGVAALALVAWRPSLLTGTVSSPPMRALVPRFSALALVAIGLVGLSGIHAAWTQTGTLIDPGTEYGRTLVAKTAVAALALALGGLNFLDGGSLRTWVGGFRRRVTVEMVAGIGVLAITASLATISPTDGATGVQIRALPDAFGEVTPGMSMTLLPGRPGVNRVAVTTTDAVAASNIQLQLVLDRTDAGTTTRVPLVSEHEGGGHAAHGEGEEAADPASAADGLAEWHADAIVLPTGSSWDTNVLLLSADGAELSRQRFSFEIDGEGVAGGADTTLLDPMALVALLLVVGGALAVGLAVGGATLPRCERSASRFALAVGGPTAAALGAAIGIGRLAAL